MKIGRVRQDVAWLMPELAGRRVEALVGVVHRDDADVLPIVVNMQLDDGLWHRFFLDAGLAFWEQWPEFADEEPEGDDVRYVNYGQQHSLVGETLRSVEARPSKPADLAELTLRFDSGRVLRLSFCDAADMGSPTCVHLGAD